MHNINILEQQLIKYKIKKYAIYILFLFGFLGFFFIFIFFLNKANKNELSANNKSKLNLFMNANIEIFEPKLTQIQSAKAIQKNRLHDTKKQGERIVSQIQNLCSSDNQLSISKNEHDSTKQKLNNNANFKSENYEMQEQPKATKQKVKLDQETNVATLIDVMKRFNESHDPNDSLFLAISYYEKKEYNKALFWAIETNKITEEIEDSWIIMAKSKFYLGDKNEALRILKAYASKTGSNEAQNIINEIENENSK